MSGVKRFVLVVSLAAVLSACQSYSTPPEAGDYWECVDRSDGRTIVRAWVLADPVLFDLDGVVEANGIRKDADYSHQGLSHRWNFDLNEEANYEGAFRIDADGSGYYFDFSSGEEKVQSTFGTNCTKYQ